MPSPLVCLVWLALNDEFRGREELPELRPGLLWEVAPREEDSDGVENGAKGGEKGPLVLLAGEGDEKGDLMVGKCKRDLVPVG